MTPDRPERRETDWLWNELNALRDTITSQHQRVREDINAGFTRVSHEVKEVDRRIADQLARIIVIETERGIEKTQAVKRGTWAGLIAASGITVALKLLDRYFGQP